MCKQRTIKNVVKLNGIGLHTGKQATITFNPAPENHGYKYRRVDIEDKPIIPALAEFVKDTSRGTTLELDGVRIHTIEHTLAALTGMQIDNVLIELDCEETPIMDGSAQPFVDLLRTAGTVEQNAKREYFEVDEVILLKDEEKKAVITIVPNNEYKVTTLINYESKVLGTQNAIMEKITDFPENFAKCRTFVFLHEIEYLFMNESLIKGGNLDNAIIFVENEVPQVEMDRLAKLLNKPTIKVTPKGILNNLELSYPNEPARHKLLDVVGDLALIGKPIKGHVIAQRPGHQSNVEFAKKIRNLMLKKEAKPQIPKFDPNKEPVFGINEIKRRIPHRYPFLLVDRIIELGADYVVGMKNVTMNESQFQGHFPDEPVMPGVLIIEAMAQTGGILALSQVENPESYSTYFLKIDNARFRKKVVPGDTLVFKLHYTAPFRRGLVQMKAIAYVGNTIVTEADLLAQVIKNK